MTIILITAFCLSLSVIMLGFWADRSAVQGRINGANGLPILVALIVSFLGSLIVAAIAGVFSGLALLGKVLLFSLSYHVILGGFLIWRLQALATLISEADKLREMNIWERAKR